MNKKRKNKTTLVSKSGEMVLAEPHMAAIAKIEDTGTAMMQAGQQMFFAVEEILRKEFKFTDDQLRHLERNCRELMENLSFVEETGLTVQSREDIKTMAHQSAQISLLRLEKLKKMRQEKTGLILPEKKEIQKLS